MIDNEIRALIQERLVALDVDPKRGDVVLLLVPPYATEGYVDRARRIARYIRDTRNVPVVVAADDMTFGVLPLREAVLPRTARPT